MRKYLKTILNFEVLNAFLGWLMFSMFTMMGLSISSALLGFSYFNELSPEIKIVTSLLLGYWFWFPHWDKRARY